jgi:quercetin dioxygenase-like cupin family protein
MNGRVARFAELVGNSGGFPDSELPGCTRTLYNVIGFRRPERTVDDRGAAIISPIGEKSSAFAPIDISEGFNLAFVEASVGNGTILHNHDTNETFVVISGEWRFHCNDDEDLVYDLKPLDTISCPPGQPRRFTNIASDDRSVDGKSLMVVIISGEGPAAIMEPEVLAAAAASGQFTPAGGK